VGPAFWRHGQCFYPAGTDDHRHTGFQTSGILGRSALWPRLVFSPASDIRLERRRHTVGVADDAVHPEGGSCDTQAVHAKLDELLHAQAAARNEITRMDEEEPEDIERRRVAERVND